MYKVYKFKRLTLFFLTQKQTKIVPKTDHMQALYNNLHRWYFCQKGIADVIMRMYLIAHYFYALRL